MGASFSKREENNESPQTIATLHGNVPAIYASIPRLMRSEQLARNGPLVWQVVRELLCPAQRVQSVGARPEHAGVDQGSPVGRSPGRFQGTPNAGCAT